MIQTRPPWLDRELDGVPPEYRAEAEQRLNNTMLAAGGRFNQACSALWDSTGIEPIIRRIAHLPPKP